MRFCGIEGKIKEQSFVRKRNEKRLERNNGESGKKRSWKRRKRRGKEKEKWGNFFDRKRGGLKALESPRGFRFNGIFLS